MSAEQKRTAVSQVLHAVIQMAHMNALVLKVILVMAKIARTLTNAVMAVQNVTEMQIVSM